MNNAFLVMVLSALLVTFGLAQTPGAASGPGPASVNGCLGGADGNYTVAENGTRETLKITTSSVDLKPHVGHDVKLTGQKTSGAATSDAAGNSFAVTDLTMISEHCVAAAAAPTATVIPPSETVIAPTEVAAAPSPTATEPAAQAAAPAATVSPSAAVVSTPATEATPPAATVGPSAAVAGTPAVEPATPAVTVGPSASAASKSAVDDARPAAAPRHSHKESATQAAAPEPTTTASPASDNVVAAAEVAPAPAVTPAPETASTPEPVAAPPETAHRAGSLGLLVSFVILVIVLGTMAPLISRWRKRKMLERDGTPNLSFTNDSSATDVSADREKPKSQKVA